LRKIGRGPPFGVWDDHLAIDSVSEPIGVNYRVIPVSFIQAMDRDGSDDVTSLSARKCFASGTAVQVITDAVRLLGG
jgi:hypothetical protein